MLPITMTAALLTNDSEGREPLIRVNIIVFSSFSFPAKHSSASIEIIVKDRVHPNDVDSGE